MLKSALCGFVVAGCLGSLAVAAHGQQVVHALTGTVSGADDVSKTLSVFQDNGSQGQFKDMTSGKSHVVIDKKIALDETTNSQRRAPSPFRCTRYMPYPRTRYGPQILSRM